MAVGNEVLRNCYNANTNRLQVAGNIAIGGTTLKLKAEQDLAVAPFEYTTSITSDFFFRGVTISFTDGNNNPVDVNEEINIILDDEDDNYDVTLLKESTLNNEGLPTSSFTFFPDSDIEVFGGSGTNFKVQVTNNNTTGIAYMVLYVEVK